MATKDKSLPNYTYRESLFDKQGFVKGSQNRIITISAGSDNNFNNCVASKFSNSMRHNSTLQAIENLTTSFRLSTKNSQGSQGQPWIAGHGDEGFLTTGCGQNDPQNTQNTMGTWNEFHWGSIFENLGRENYAILSILSCDTGAGQDGADLLFAIAQRTGRAVRARTGLTSCGNNITYEEGSTWQTATPNVRPDPINPPLHIFKTPELIRIMTETELNTININTVESVNVTRKRRFLSEQSDQYRLEGKEAQGIISLIDLEHPFQLSGAPAALVSAELTIEFADKNVNPLKFVIYNNRIAQDISFPEVFYYVAPGFKTLMK